MSRVLKVPSTKTKGGCVRIGMYWSLVISCETSVSASLRSAAASAMVAVCVCVCDCDWDFVGEV